MEELMQSNLLHNPKVVSDVNNTTTNPGDTADTAAIVDATTITILGYQ